MANKPKKQPVVTKRGGEPVRDAVKARKEAGPANQVDHEERARHQRATPVFNQLNRLASGMSGITPEHVVKALRLDKERSPRAYAAAMKAAQQVADAGDRAEAQQLASRAALDIQDVIDAEPKPEMSRFEIFQRVTGRHPH